MEADIFGMYPPRYVTMSNTRCNSFALVGVGIYDRLDFLRIGFHSVLGHHFSRLREVGLSEYTHKPHPTCYKSCRIQDMHEVRVLYRNNYTWWQAFASSMAEMDFVVVGTPLVLMLVSLLDAPFCASVRIYFSVASAA